MQVTSSANECISLFHYRKTFRKFMTTGKVVFQYYRTNTADCFTWNCDFAISRDNETSSRVGSLNFYNLSKVYIPTFWYHSSILWIHIYFTWRYLCEYNQNSASENWTNNSCECHRHLKTCNFMYSFLLSEEDTS